MVGALDPGRGLQHFQRGRSGHESVSTKALPGKRSIQASTDHAASYPATNCEFLPDLSRLRHPVRAKLTGLPLPLVLGL